MRLRRFAVFISVCTLGLVGGCEGKDAEAPPESAVPDAAEPAAEPATDPRCVGPVAAGTPEEVKEFKVGNKTWSLRGSTLSLKAATNGTPLVLGAITDIKEDSPENLANLRAFVAWFKKKKVDAVVVAGDTGETQKQIESALAVLAKAKVPVLNIIGNREGKGDYQAAMESVAAKHKLVFNLNVVRRVDMPQADIVSLPGYFNANYIHSEDGCQYTEKDLAKLDELVKMADSPVILVSHGGPKQEGAAAIDRTAEGANVGDPLLAKAIEHHKIPFGIFGNIHEAGGRATDRLGKTLIETSKPEGELYLNPGPADGVRWVMNDDSQSLGMAATMTVKDGKASYEIFRMPDPEAKLAKKGKGRKGKKKRKKK